MNKEEQTIEFSTKKALSLADVVAMLPTEREVDEWFTNRSENPPYCNIKTVRAIEGANKYRAIMIQRLEKLQGTVDDYEKVSKITNTGITGNAEKIYR